MLGNQTKVAFSIITGIGFIFLATTVAILAYMSYLMGFGPTQSHTSPQPPASSHHHTITVMNQDAIIKKLLEPYRVKLIQ